MDALVKLYFLRHGPADWPDWEGADDERPLTDAGREEVRAVGEFLVRLKARPALLVASPLPRAAQTAAIAAECLGVKWVEERLLAPGFGMRQWARLRERHREESLMLVGHEPDFSGMIGALTGGRVKVSKAGVALVELKGAERGELRWLFPPAFAR